MRHFHSFRLMFIKVWWKSWRESLMTVRSQKKMMPCGLLQTESGDRFVGIYIFAFNYLLLSLLWSPWDGVCYTLHHNLYFIGTGDRHWWWTHFIHNFQNWIFNWCQPVQVNIFHNFFFFSSCSLCFTAFSHYCLIL